MSRFKLKNHKIFNKYMSFYTLIIIIPLFVLGYANYYISIRLIDQKNEKIYKSTLLKTQNSIETIINTFNSLATSLLNNRRLGRVIYENKDIAEMAGKLEYYYAISELNQSAVYYNYIDSIALYVKNSDTILHSGGINSSSDFLKNAFTENISDITSLLSECSMLSNNLYYAMPDTINTSFNRPNTFAIIKTFPTSGLNINGAFILFISTDLFERILPSSEHQGEISALLIDEKNNLIAGNPYFYESLENLHFAGDKKVRKNIKIDNISYNTLYKELDIFQWKLLVYVPSTSTEHLYGYTKWFIAVLIIFTIFGLFLSFMISYSNYKPINQIMNAIKKEYIYFNDNIAINSDEYHFIESNMISMNKTAVDLRKTASFFKSLASDLYIIKLLSDTHLNKSEINAISKLLGVDFKNTGFLVCTLSSQPLSNSSDIKQIEENRLSFSEYLQQLNKEISSMENTCVYSVNNLNNSQSLLFYWNNSFIPVTKFQIPYNYIMGILGKTIIGWNSVKREKIFLGVGSVAANADKINNSYVNSLNSLSLAILIDSHTAVEFISYINEEFKPFFYPIELETDILSSLKIGDYPKIHSALVLILDKNTNDRSLNLVSARCLLYELYATLIKGRKLLDVNNTDKSVLGISKIYSISTLINHIDSEFEKLCLKMISKDTLDDIASQIKEFINKSILNPDLSLNYVAYKFQVSPYHISRVFQSDTEAGFLDYINTKRIQYAAQLLKDADYSIAEVGKMSGFSNLYTFKRVFKRYKGTTPSNFKQFKKSSTY